MDPHEAVTLITGQLQLQDLFNTNFKNYYKYY